MDQDKTPILPPSSAQDLLQQAKAADTQYQKLLKNIPIENKVEKVVRDFYNRYFNAISNKGIGGTELQPLGPKTEDELKFLNSLKDQWTNKITSELTDRIKSGERVFASEGGSGYGPFEEVTKMLEGETKAGRLPPAAPSRVVPPKPQALLDLKPRVNPHIEELKQAATVKTPNILKYAGPILKATGIGSGLYDIAKGDVASGAVTLAEMANPSYTSALFELLRPTPAVTEEQEFSDNPMLKARADYWKKIKDSMGK